jgi:MFS family permease
MIYPTVMAFIAKRFPGGSDTAITFTVTLMGVGSVIGNYLIGGVIEGAKAIFGGETETGLLRGLQAGYGFIGLCAAVCAVCSVVLYRSLKKRNELI